MARAVSALALFALGVWVMFRWASSCGFTWGDNPDVPRTGRACGAVKSGIYLLLPFAGVVPLAMPEARAYYGAVAALLVVFLGVAFVLAPSA
jgi:hypothetical protein